MNAQTNSAVQQNQFDVLIVGAGWGGMYMLLQCRKLGLSARVLEAGASVGGTWYWNRYPGLHCDVESVQYSFSFDRELEQSWSWKERYASQAEILEYANHVAERFDLRRDISFNTRVNAAHLDEASHEWRLHTEDGREFKSRFVVMATGCMSAPKPVNIPGVESFKGKSYHTAYWPEGGVDFTGQRVGIIGTGSSGIQCIPKIAEQARHLHVFQRTPSYSIPAKNRKLEASYTQEIKSHYDKLRDDARHHVVGIPAPTYAESIFQVDEKRRKEIFDYCYDSGLPFALMVTFGDILIDEKANQLLQEYLASRIRERVKDPEIAEQLIPKGQFAGTRRLCIDTNYYETFNRPNVTLNNLLRNPIESITSKGVKLQNGEEVELDALVFATGYDAMTGALTRIDIQGVNGLKLREQWSAGPRTMMGLMMAGFPNLFTVTGPGSPSVLSNMVVSIEQHVEWIAACLSHMQQQGKKTIEPSLEAQEQWVSHVNAVANATLFPRGNTWYMGANVPGKPRVFLPYLGVGTYRALCDEVAKANYKGFMLA